MTGEIRNRRFWDADADAYQDAHGAAFARRARAWGVWRIPESELQHPRRRHRRRRARARMRGRAVVGQRSPRPVRVPSASISHGRSSRRAARGRPNRGSARSRSCGERDRVAVRRRVVRHRVLRSRRDELLRPARIVPEVARVVRPGGTLAFCAATPLLYLTWDAEKDARARRLHLAYSDLGRMDFGDGTIDWALPPGDWIRLLRGQRSRDRGSDRAHAAAERDHDLRRLRSPQVGAAVARRVDLEGAED